MIEYIGFNSIRNLKEILKKKKFQKIFLITGRKSFENAKIDKIILSILKNHNVYRFSDYTLNPNIVDIKKGLDLFRSKNCDAIIAIGGGTVIDIGKCISIFSTNLGKIEDFIFKKKKINKAGKPLIRIPTTAGSGSEATHFAVVYIGKKKYSIAHSKYMQPKYVILDPQFTLSLPSNISATSGMDAFCQAIESYWNINSTKKSKRYGKKAIELVIENILKVVKNPDRESRFNMALAANYSGKAINITKTTACHAISYPITSFFNVPHGHAVALTLPSMLIFNSEVSQKDILDSRGVKYVRKTMMDLISIIGTTNFPAAKNFINKLMVNIGLEIKLKNLGINNKNDIDLIVENGFNPDRVKNNPRKLTESELRKLLEAIM
jgi:alcohol dehydrogenase class IV